MLMLSRREGETIVIGEDIEVTISEISGRNVKLGISAPKKIRIYRKESGTKYSFSSCVEDSDPKGEE